MRTRLKMTNVIDDLNRLQEKVKIFSDDHPEELERMCEEFDVMRNQVIDWDSMLDGTK